MNMISRRVPQALLGLALLAAGCAPGTGDVSGKVTYKGQPLAGATITFYDASNNSPSCPIDDEGNYKVQKLAVGKARVVILTPLPIVFKGVQGTGGEKLGGDKKTPKIPAKYSDPEKSGLTYEVKGGSQTKDFAIAD
jgi:hypothetical protein